jgi:hypothetical protein
MSSDRRKRLKEATARLGERRELTDAVDNLLDKFTAPPKTAPAEMAPPTGTGQPLPMEAAPVAAPATPAPAESEGAGQWTAYRNDFWDALAPTLEPVDTVVLAHLLRLTVGFARETCTIGLPRLAARCNCGLNTLRRSLARLEARGLVRRVEVENRGHNRDRGSVFAVDLAPPKVARPTAAPATTARAKSAPPTPAPMISEQKDEQKELRFVVRERAARIRHAEPGISRDEIVTAVLRGLAGEGREATREDVESALAGLAL